jgi:fumarylacetoacetase
MNSTLPPGLDATHDPQTRSWLASANAADTDFPIQNLPWGRFRSDGAGPWRIGVAIGDAVLDVQAVGLLEHADMVRLLSAPAQVRRDLRRALWQGLRDGAAEQQTWRSALWPQANVQLGLPCEVGDFTDFYSGIHHARAVGTMFRPQQPLLPNYQWLPIGYHGRASSLLPAGKAFHRPWGQTLPAGASAPVFGPCQRLDYELELAAWIGSGNPLGSPIPVGQAQAHLAGITLLNDWSARDIQTWEYQPLGPFLAKSFASTVSPWLVTPEALAPFRCAPTARAAGDPAPLPYLHDATDQALGSWDIRLEVWLQTAAMRAQGQDAQRLSTSNLRDAYWTVAQLLAHHSSGGCNLRTGDVLGTGTLSGPLPEQGGSLLELTRGGQRPLELTNGESRRFLEDGDTVTLRACCERPGARRIGFGACHASVLPAHGGPQT